MRPPWRACSTSAPPTPPPRRSPRPSSAWSPSRAARTPARGPGSRPAGRPGSRARPLATSIQKVRQPRLMYQQNELFRSAGAGPFEALTLAVARDAAMLIWLDGNANRRQSPNENFARELM
ncbi:MAG TPA: DUF1800 family protein, partial [Actinomycetota bacterium]|nr:DUF1800 family protein [Actinomycetota bacterium]